MLVKIRCDGQCLYNALHLRAKSHDFITCRIALEQQLHNSLIVLQSSLMVESAEVRI